MKYYVDQDFAPGDSGLEFKPKEYKRMNSINSVAFQYIDKNK